MEAIQIPPHNPNDLPLSRSSRAVQFIKTRWMLLSTIIICLVIVCSLGAIAWVMGQSSPQASDSNTANQPTPTPSVQPSATPTPSPTPTPSATPTPTLTPTPTSTPTPTPAANITPFTAADCNGSRLVYVSNPQGTPVSYQPPDNWQTVKTYEYGQAIMVHCEVGQTAYGSTAHAPEYALVNDAFIATSDLSTTQP